jgi:hypothetical protein
MADGDALLWRWRGDTEEGEKEEDAHLPQAPA